MLDELQRHSLRLLELGLIRPSKSSLDAGVFFVKKSDETWRMVCDWRGLNSITFKDATYMPHMDDLFDEIGDATVMSKMDCWDGFNQVRVRYGDIWKTAMHTPLGNYEWLVMGMELTNAPASFQRMMTGILHPFL
jgi:hypothetical protein